jgi:hypothetical protein
MIISNLNPMKIGAIVLDMIISSDAETSAVHAYNAAVARARVVDQPALILIRIRRWKA